MIKLKQLLNEKTVKVPNGGKLKNEKAVKDFIKKLGGKDKVNNDVWNGETGEIWMEKGDSKAKLAKKNKHYTDDYDKWELYTFDNDKDEFEDYFYVVYRDNAKGMSDEEKEMLRSGDYDYDFSFPSKIKRKDGKKFTQNDKENIEDFADWYTKKVLYGGNIKINVGIGSKIADGEPQYV
jgi:hypothetical protein